MKSNVLKPLVIDYMIMVIDYNFVNQFEKIMLATNNRLLSPGNQLPESKTLW